MRSTRKLQRLACQRRPSVVVVAWREDGLPWRQKAAKQQGKGPSTSPPHARASPPPSNSCVCEEGVFMWFVGVGRKGCREWVDNPTCLNCLCCRQQGATDGKIVLSSPLRQQCVNRRCDDGDQVDEESSGGRMADSRQTDSTKGDSRKADSPN